MHDHDTSPFGFGRFVPGFDFLQSLTQGAAAGMPSMPNWVAPTASVQELDKRIQELKTVQFWLEQNVRALSATVQALEVQKMTLATLAGMNVAVGDMAAAFGAMGAGAARPDAGTPPPAAAQQPPAASAPPPQAGAAAASAGQAPRAEAAAAAGPMADPLQWWGALTQQFQQIAARAVQDTASHQAAFDATSGVTGEAPKSAGDPASQWATGAGGAAPRPSPAPAAPKKPAPRDRSKK